MLVTASTAASVWRMGRPVSAVMASQVHSIIRHLKTIDFYCSCLTLQEPGVRRGWGRRCWSEVWRGRGPGATRSWWRGWRSGGASPPTTPPTSWLRQVMMTMMMMMMMMMMIMMIMIMIMAATGNDDVHNHNWLIISVSQLSYDPILLNPAGWWNCSKNLK